MKRRTVLMTLLAATIFGSAWAEGFRTVVSSTVEVDPAKPDGVTVSMRYNEAVGVVLPEGPLFMEGIELEIRVPSVFRGAESMIAWSVYAGVHPLPSQGGVDFNGDLLATQTLPARVSAALRIPLTQKHGMRASPFYLLVPIVTGPDRYPLMFKLSAIGKGLSSGMETAEFIVIVRPVLTDEGGITLSIDAEGELVTPQVFLDDLPVEGPSTLIVARKGLRTLRVVAEGYREEILSVGVEAGKITQVAVTLVPDAPRLIIHAPQGASIVLDGKPLSGLEWSGLSLDPGEHTVVCRIGDYAITRKFSALKGKVYTVELAVVLEIRISP